MKADTTSQIFFERKYRQEDDPWNFASSSYEKERYDAIFRALSHRRYDDAFEPGCSIGVLTARLASVCGHVQATDISPTAVQHAHKRCKDLPNVEITCEALPGLIPATSFDLVVLSEIGYYLKQDQLHALGTTLVERLREQGVLLAAHWLGKSEDHLLSGDCVHEVLQGLDGIVLERSERQPGFRLDRWVRG
jgi:protein-L-isoaspartate O-methyltransferase